MITQAFVLGAGLGTRLRPLTDDLPKPLVPIFQKPLITFALDHLIDVGITKFFVNTHRQPERFAQFLPGAVYRGRPIEFRHEPLLLETGGGIKNIEASLGTAPFIVYGGDVLTDVDLAPLIDEHLRRENDVTLALRKTGLDAGVVLRDGQIVAIRNKSEPPGDYDYAGISIWNAGIFERIPPATKISFIPILVEWIGQGGRIGGVVLSEKKWFNIGTRADYLEVHRTIFTEHWKPSYVNAPEWPISIAPDAIIWPKAQLSGFYSIGAGCSVGEDVMLENTILWPGAQIASRSRLQNCIVRSHQKAQGALHDLDI
jgi:NDP-sugar pyrophosphorylase family protein